MLDGVSRRVMMSFFSFPVFFLDVREPGCRAGGLVTAILTPRERVDAERRIIKAVADPRPGPEVGKSQFGHDKAAVQTPQSRNAGQSATTVDQMWNVRAAIRHCGSGVGGSELGGEGST